MERAIKWYFDAVQKQMPMVLIMIVEQPKYPLDGYPGGTRNQVQQCLRLLRPCSDSAKFVLF